MKHSDLFSHIETAARTWAKANNMSSYLTGELVENLRMNFIAGVEQRPPLRIRHENTHAAKCCLED